MIGGHHRRRGQGYGRRATGLLESVLLMLLHHEPAHGYTLLEGVNEFGLNDMDPSAVYRTLRDMESRGWVASSWNEQDTLGPPRRVYCITHAGDDVLATWIQDLDDTSKLLARLVNMYQRHMEVCKGEHYPRPAGGEPQDE